MKTNSVLDRSITLLSLTVMFDFVDIQSTIQKIKQDIQEEYDFYK